MQYAKIAVWPRRMTRSDPSAKDPRSGALADLLRAVQALRRHMARPEDLDDLDLIEEAAVRLSNPREATANGISDFDPTRLANLLQITGPSVGAELLARLGEDLVITRETLAAGTDTGDWKRLREGSHVLISLSGSVGALSLQAMSEDLNAIAHRQDREALVALMPPLEAELSALIRVIRATRVPSGSPA